MTQIILEGKLLLYSATGTEGGYLSFQDKKFTNLTSPTYGISNNCIVWDKDDLLKQGVTSNAEVLLDGNWIEFPDPIWKDKDFEISSLHCGELNGDLNADKRLSEKYEFKIKYSVERLDEAYGEGNWKIDRKLPNVILKDGTHLHFGDSPTTIPSRPYGIPKDGKTRVSVTWKDNTIEHRKLSDDLLVEQSDYKGLYMLKEGDILKVMHPKTKDIICEGQIDQIPLKIFSQTIKGHFDQVNKSVNGNCNWEMYFVENYLAELHRK
ncbi:hypothetical protein [Pontibacter sp. H249]|uniref:hypothetical protein n=1 Tax=Pontibacter sp. H249 TaxID=3133420 RepID=UPI0030C44E85